MNKFYKEFDFQRIEQRKSTKSLADIRTPFQRDRDRVLHSDYFRRLQNKTQVLFPGEFDFYRTRLTHTIEVAQLGRSIAYYLSKISEELINKSYVIDNDLVEAICLSHDIGHPPFGHLGESIFNEIMDGPYKSKYLHKVLLSEFKTFLSDIKNDVHDFKDPGFEANAQNLRIIENLAYSLGNKGRVGFNPTFASWEGVLKYRYTPEFLKKEDLNTIKFVYESTYRSYSDLQQIFINNPMECNVKSIENQIMEFADDMAYSILDIEDAFKSGFIGKNNVEEIKAHIQYYCDINKHVVPDYNGISIINVLSDLLSNSVNVRKYKNRFLTYFINSIRIKKVDNISNRIKEIDSNRFDYELYYLHENIPQMINVFKEIVRKFVYTTPHIKQMQHSFPKIILRTFEAFYYDSKMLPVEVQHYLPENLSEDQKKKYKEIGLEIWSKSRVICDYLSGMSDTYLIKQYKKIYEGDSQRIFDFK